MIYKASKKHGIPAQIYTAILMQESAYNQMAISKHCGITDLINETEECVWTDLGIAQINYKTAKSYDFEISRLFSDLEYSIDSGAQVLAWFHKKYSKKEPSRWWTRYNCGTKKSVYRKTCKTYFRKVNRWK